MENKGAASQGTADYAEESGWTAYFEEFSNNRSEHSFCSSFDSSSMVSDAASGPARKLKTPHNKDHHLLSYSSFAESASIPKRLSFKKTRTKEISHDDSLEDTASSPVNSPKISDMNPRKTDDHVNSSLMKVGKSEHHGELVHTDDRCEMNFNGDNRCTDLKKRGLCLVPLSMLVNYLG